MSVKKANDVNCRAYTAGSAALIAIASIWAATWATTTFAADDAPTRWRTGAEFRQQMESSVGVAWQGSRLSDVLQKLALQNQTAVFLDRRVDPDQRVEFTYDGALEDLFQRLSGRLKLGVSRVGSVVYLGPVETAARLATFAAVRRAEIAAMSNDVRRRFVGPQASSWDELSEPRALVAELLASFRLSASESDLQKIPHDLWPARELPPLAFAERLTLLLAGFDLTFQVANDGQSIRLGRMPEKPRHVDTYAARGDSVRLAADLAKKFPQAEIRSVDGKVQVSGLYEDHDLIDRLLRGERIRRTPAGGAPAGATTLYTMKVERQSFAAVAKTLAEQLTLELELAPGLADRLTTQVSFQVSDATVQQLLDALAKAAGVAYRLEGKRLTFAAQ